MLIILKWVLKTFGMVVSTGGFIWVTVGSNGACKQGKRLSVSCVTGNSQDSRDCTLRRQKGCYLE
jgi:hypothetical protein